MNDVGLRFLRYKARKTRTKTPKTVADDRKMVQKGLVGSSYVSKAIGEIV